ncbi:MAG: FG-GAP-like repeat-containing protein [Myxococcota bacterium]
MKKRLLTHALPALAAAWSPSAFAMPPGGAVSLATDAAADFAGVSIVGRGDQLGHAMAYGDLNGDGVTDLVVGAAGTESVSVFFGPLSGTNNVSDHNAVYEGTTGSEAGWSVAVGDLTGDGIDDLIVGEPSTHGGSGDVVVVEGPLADGGRYTYFSSEVIYSFYGESIPIPQFAGYDLAVGDFDGDGSTDLVVGACGAADADPEFGDPVRRPVGVTYFFSQGDMVPGAANGLLLGATSRIWGMGATGCAVANAGDTNGDGLDDLLLGSPQHGSSSGSSGLAAGAVTLIEGRESWDADYRLSTYTGTTTLRLNVLADIYTLTGPSNFGQNVGHSVAGVGDVNNDGYADILIGAPAYLTSSGIVSTTLSRAYLVYGAPDASGLQGNSALTSNAALVFVDSNAARLGWDVSPAGDIDGDGASDYLIGSFTGAGYLYYGVNDPSFSVSYSCSGFGGCTASYPATAGLTGTLNLGDADASFSGAGYLNTAGSPDNHAGRTLIGSPDLTGDGSPDIVIGAPGQGGFGTTNYGPGHVYVINGN